MRRDITNIIGISFLALAVTILGIVYVPKCFSVTSDAYTLTIPEMGNFLGGCECKTWQGGQDCHECLRHGSTKSKRYEAYWPAGLADTCTEGNPPGCEMTGTHECGWGWWEVYTGSTNCSGDYYVSGETDRDIPDAEGEPCACC